MVKKYFLINRTETTSLAYLLLEAFRKDFLVETFCKSFSRVILGVNWIVEIRYAIRTPTLAALPILFFEVKGILKYTSQQFYSLKNCDFVL